MPLADDVRHSPARYLARDLYRSCSVALCGSRRLGGTAVDPAKVEIVVSSTLIASIVHAIGFGLYNLFNPEFKSLFLEKFAEYKMGQLAGPPSPEAVEAANREIAMVRTVQVNPLLDFIVSLITITILPGGVIVTFLSAALLRNRGTSNPDTSLLN